MNGYYADEHNNVLLINKKEYIAFLRYQDHWLQVKTNIDNATVQVKYLNLNEFQLVQYIHRNYNGWYIQEANIDGLKINGSRKIDSDSTWKSVRVASDTWCCKNNSEDICFVKDYVSWCGLTGKTKELELKGALSLRKNYKQ
jgi:hypothetical protein